MTEQKGTGCALEICTSVLALSLLTVIKMSSVTANEGISGWLYWPAVLAACAMGMMAVAIYDRWEEW